ncbi:hypothetical protein DUI87_04363 [Hirundo rustica rustica]|uniref:Uncharacterized protein n=1 Tax=Hirundo rustica rustica TaxID=333673 RepID=A0A3M0L3P2_HIRRU|nr:hypothetical protein DUI87_04363 [Hirundo rustica rustica]
MASGACKGDGCCLPEEMGDSNPLRRWMAISSEEMAASACQGDASCLAEERGIEAPVLVTEQEEASMAIYHKFTNQIE